MKQRPRTTRVRRRVSGQVLTERNGAAAGRRHASADAKSALEQTSVGACGTRPMCSATDGRAVRIFSSGSRCARSVGARWLCARITATGETLSACGATRHALQSRGARRPWRWSGGSARSVDSVKVSRTPNRRTTHTHTLARQTAHVRPPHCRVDPERLESAAHARAARRAGVGARFRRRCAVHYCQRHWRSWLRDAHHSRDALHSSHIVAGRVPSTALRRARVRV